MKHNCPCMSGLAYSACCKPLLKKQRAALTAEALMRSRYTAYAKNDAVYLYKTWHPDTRPALSDICAEQLADPIEWIGLKVLHSEQEKNTGTVEFIASYKSLEGIGQLKELSHFICENDKWLYING